MTTHNSLQQYTDLSRAYKNALGLDEGGLERAGETLTPTFPLFELPEYALQRGELIASYYGLSGAVAGQYSGVGVGVPATTRYLIVVEPQTRPIVQTGALSSIIVRGTNYTGFAADLVNVGYVYTHDTRRWNGAGAMLNNPAPVVGRGGAAAIPTGDTLGLLYSNSATPFAEPLGILGPFVIGPGYALTLWTPAVNQGITAHFRLRVRPLQPGEGSA